MDSLLTDVLQPNQASPWNFDSNQSTGFIYTTLHRSNESPRTHI